MCRRDRYNAVDIVLIGGKYKMDTNKRPESMERITTPQLAEAFIEEQIEAIKKQDVYKRQAYKPRRSCIA